MQEIIKTYGQLIDVIDELEGMNPDIAPVYSTQLFEFLKKWRDYLIDDKEDYHERIPSWGIVKLHAGILEIKQVPVNELSDLDQKIMLLHAKEEKIFYEMEELILPLFPDSIDYSPLDALTCSDMDFDLTAEIIRILEGEKVQFMEVQNPDTFMFSFIQVHEVHDNYCSFRRWKAQKQFLKDILITPEVASFLQSGKSYLIHSEFVNVNGIKKEIVNFALTSDDAKAFDKSAKLFQPLINSYLHIKFNV